MLLGRGWSRFYIQLIYPCFGYISLLTTGGKITRPAYTRKVVAGAHISAIGADMLSIFQICWGRGFRFYFAAELTLGLKCLNKTFNVMYMLTLYGICFWIKHV